MAELETLVGALARAAATVAGGPAGETPVDERVGPTCLGMGPATVGKTALELAEYVEATIETRDGAALTGHMRGLFRASAPYAGEVAALVEAYLAVAEAGERRTREASARRWQAALASGRDRPGQGPDVVAEIELRLEAGPRPCRVDLVGGPRSGRTGLLDAVEAGLRATGRRVVRTAVPAPYSLQAMGVALLRALDPDYDEALDRARSETVWNKARRIVGGVDVVLVDDLGNVDTGRMEADWEDLSSALRSLCGTSGRAVHVVAGEEVDVVDLRKRDEARGSDLVIRVREPTAEDCAWIVASVAARQRLTLDAGFAAHPEVPDALVGIASGGTKGPDGRAVASAGLLADRVAKACAAARREGRAVIEPADLDIRPRSSWWVPGDPAAPEPVWDWGRRGEAGSTDGSGG